MSASQGETGALRAARGTGGCSSAMRRGMMRRCVVGRRAIAAHIAIHIAVRIAAARLRIVTETAVLVAFAALVLGMLMTAVRCGVTAEAAAAVVAASGVTAATACLS